MPNLQANNCQVKQAFRCRTYKQTTAKFNKHSDAELTSKQLPSSTSIQMPNLQANNCQVQQAFRCRTYQQTTAEFNKHSDDELTSNQLPSSTSIQMSNLQAKNKCRAQVRKRSCRILTHEHKD